MSLVDGGVDLRNHNVMKLGRIIFGILLFFVSFQTHADSNEKLKVFLTSCAYGTAAGALVGVASLAFASNPTQSTNNIAVGASLGLYTGIAIGLYQTVDNTPKQEVGSAYVTPDWYKGKVEGAQLHVFAAEF